MSDGAPEQQDAVARMIDEAANRVHRTFTKHWVYLGIWWLAGAGTGLFLVGALFAVVALLQSAVLIMFAWCGRSEVARLFAKQELFAPQRFALAVMRVTLIVIGYGGLLVFPAVHILLALGVIPGAEEAFGWPAH